MHDDVSTLVVESLEDVDSWPESPIEPNGNIRQDEHAKVMVSIDGQHNATSDSATKRLKPKILPTDVHGLVRDVGIVFIDSFCFEGETGYFIFTLSV